MRYEKLVLFFMILSLCLPSSAQNQEEVIVRGHVEDKSGTPIPYATVFISLASPPFSFVKGGITDDKGDFAVPARRQQTYTLKVSCLGYKEYAAKIQVDTASVQLKKIVMEETSYKISEVRVKPPLQVTADKIIYNFENDPERRTANLYDQIRKMPLVHIEADGRITIGSADKTYIVLRKGKEDALFNFQNIKFEELIKKLPAMGFTAFEIWTVVPQKYSRYDYVVNILPDPEQRLFGATAAPRVRYNAETGSVNTQLGINGSADIIRFSGGVQYEHTDSPRNTSKVSTTLYAKGDSPESDILQETENRYNAEHWKANLATSIDITKKQFVSIKADAGFSESERQRLTHTRENAGSISNSFSRYFTRGDIDSWSVSAGYQFDFKKFNRSLNISYLFESSPIERYDRRNTEHDTETAGNEKLLVKEKEKSRNQRIQLEYYDRFLQDRLKLNAQIGYLKMDFDNESITWDSLNNREDKDRYTALNQDFHRLDGFVYVSYNVNKKLNLNVRMAADYLPDPHTAHVINGTHEEDVRQKRLLLNPQGEFRYQFRIPLPASGSEKPFDEMSPAEQSEYIRKNMAPGRSLTDIVNGAGGSLPNSTVRFIYRLRQNRPGILQLVNYTDVQNPLYYQTGNPNLRVEMYHNFNCMFSSWFLNSLFADYSFSNNRIVMQTRREGGKLVRTYYNAGKTKDFSCGLSHRVWKSRLLLSSSFRHYSIDYGDGNRNRLNKLGLKASYNMSLARNLSLLGSLKYDEDFDSGTERSESVFPLDLSFDFSWSPRIAGQTVWVAVGLTNVFQWKQRTDHYLDMSEYSQYSRTTRQGFPVWVSLSTTFGKFKVKPVRNTKSKAQIRGFSTDPETE